MNKRNGIKIVICIVIILLAVVMGMYKFMDDGFVIATEYPLQFEHLLPAGFDNGDFDEYLGRGGGYLFRKLDE